MTTLALTRQTLADHPLPDPPENSDKHARGTTLIVAGGATCPGAAILTGRAALRVGAGRLRLAAPRTAATALGLAVPEAGILRVAGSASGDFGVSARRALAQAGRECDSAVVGPGLTAARVAAALTRALLAADPAIAMVVDAAALPRGERGFGELAAGRVVLTPHAGEMAGMMGVSKAAVEADPLGFARQAAERFQSVTVMKGATTHVVTPSGRSWRHDGGVVGLATSGSGDVLAGVIGGLLARGAAPERAAVWGVYLHAVSGARLAESVGPLGFIASDLLDVLPRVMAASDD